MRTATNGVAGGAGVRGAGARRRGMRRRRRRRRRDATDGTRRRRRRRRAATAPTATTEAPTATTEHAADRGDRCEAPARPVECDTPDPVKLQLQWFIQAQFAGYFAADRPGLLRRPVPRRRDPRGRRRHRAAAGSSPTARPTSPSPGCPRRCRRARPAPTSSNIAQIFQRSGTLQVSFADAGITTPADFAGKKIGNWGFGNEYEIFAALGEAGLDPATDVDLVAAAVRHARPAGRRHRRRRGDDVQRVRPGARGREPGHRRAVHAGGLQRHLLRGRRRRHAAGRDLGRRRPARRATPTTSDIATRFVAASIEGWAYCRDNPEACRDIVVAAGSQLGDSHQLWQMNEINKLIWPAAGRHRHDRRGGVGPHGRDRPEHAEPRGRDGADGAADRRARTPTTSSRRRIALLGDSRRHDGRRLRADRGHAREPGGG